MMRAVLLVLLVALAGCSDAPDAAPESPADSTPVVTPAGVDPLVFTVNTPEPVEGLTWTATGTVDRAVTLDFAVSDGQANLFSVGPGEWTADVELDVHGFNTVAVTAAADDGSFAELTLDVNALAPARLTLDFGSASSTPPTDDSFWVDMTTHASGPMYDDVGGRHPDMVTVHDVMVVWEAATGHSVDYSYSERYSAFNVERIDDEGNALSAGEPPWWCFDVNGERADFGISLQPFTPGDRIDWDLGTC